MLTEKRNWGSREGLYPSRGLQPEDPILDLGRWGAGGRKDSFRVFRRLCDRVGRKEVWLEWISEAKMILYWWVRGLVGLFVLEDMVPFLRVCKENKR